MEGVNVCACTSHMTLGINARVPQHEITYLAMSNFLINLAAKTINENLKIWKIWICLESL
ncbi:hypothetical protein BpHYR1_022825 [Brachionus plicatilis]|uniref:Uncharacterized protein n=1 Tax=Brachionus plicatilis TaxID=10195 RepID=A0A3M7SDE1_BRAPC|nr:hypothetical protein BpHYR1_022825 [Brachionus plicatilis]